MRRLLGEQADAFLTCFQDAAGSRPPFAGLRANTLKLTPGDLRSRLPFQLQPLPWTTSAFRLTETPEMQPGKHVYHAAGLYYLQEPSAMAAAGLLDPQAGERVLDLCAAPGSKTTHLAALMNGQGVLVANETHPGRVWELAENLERWGARNAIVTQESPARLAGRWRAFFDKILVDAPCSGEGMFRKSQAAIRDWNPEHTARCAQRQAAILDSAAQMLKPGGALLYSTCTFNPLENESVVALFLDRHPDFEIAPLQPATGFSPGRPDWLPPAESRPDLAYAVRIWPHLAPGEGHFMALLRRKTGSPLPPNSAGKPRRPQKAHTPAAFAAFQDFCRLNLQPCDCFDRPGGARLLQAGGYLYLQPPDAPDLSGLHVIHPGWWLGSFSAGSDPARQRFEPSHALALGLKREQAQRVLELPTSDPTLATYLRGEILERQMEDGWVLIAVDGFPLGWGKSVRGRVKNFYPRGLRWR